MNREIVLSDHSVLVRAGRFAEVAPAGTLKVPVSATRIDARGKFLMPGMGEMHGHIPPPTSPRTFIEDVLLLYVANGITTVRGMLGHPGQLELRTKATRNEITAPTLYLAGPSFSGSTVTSVAQAEQRVRQQKDEGWDLLKIHPGLTREQYDAVARTAKQVKIPFAGHVPTDVGLVHALEQGQQTIDHLDGYIEYLGGGDEPIGDAKLQEAARRTKAADAWVVPTMVLWETILGAPPLATLQAFPELKYMPRDLLEQWNKAYQARQSDSRFNAARVKRVAEDRKRLLKYLDDQKVKILFGTDSPQQFSVPGFSMHREVKAMAEAGMKPYDILRSGTAAVGEYFQDAEKFGTITTGSRADAILLDGNPLERVDNLSRVAGVMVRGRWISGAEIQKALADIARRNGGQSSATDWIPWRDPRLEIRGLPWFQENRGETIRLPLRLKDALPPAVWNLGLSPSGGRIRFRTNSTRLAIRLEYPSPPNMANMHAFGQTGVDLYLDGVYRSTATAPKDAASGKTVEYVFFEGLPRATRDVLLYLPLYKPVNVLGVQMDADAEISSPRRFATSKPVVFYGTSITQGGCASRSGMSYQAILARQLNLDFVNLGFSGNGKGEPVVARMTAEIDAAAFVLDFAGNNPTVESLKEVYEPFLATVRAKHPNTPIIAVTPIARSREDSRTAEMRKHIGEVVTAKIAAGDSLLTLVDGLSLLGPNQLDGLVDGAHPNDLGFQWMADGLAPRIAKVLNLPPPVLTNDRPITVTSLAVAQNKREEIIRYIWGAAAFPRNQRPAETQRNAPSPIAGLKNVKSLETMTIRMEAGQENTTHHFLAQRGNGKLVVLQHGHGCTFDDLNTEKSYGLAHAVDQMLGEGYGVLIAYMPHMRPNDCSTMPHGKMFNLPVAAGSPLKFFLEPVAISLNVLKPRYKEIHMEGLSGGGWTTTLYAAIDPSIRTSFPVAGSIPLYLRIGGSVGDLEQYLDEFYRFAGYPDLYALGAIGPGRKQVQILNRRDDCCFGEAQHDARRVGSSYEDAYRTYERAVQQALGTLGEFRLVIDDAAPRHMISAEAVRIMLREMKTPR